MAKRRIYDDGGVVANAILQQIGGSGRLRAMTGAYNFIDLNIYTNEYKGDQAIKAEHVLAHCPSMVALMHCSTC